MLCELAHQAGTDAPAPAPARRRPAGEAAKESYSHYRPSASTQHPAPPREARLSSDNNPHSRRLHIQSLDAVAQRERLAYLGARVGLHDVSVDQEVEHTSLDGDAGNLHLFHVHGRGSTGRPDAGGDGNGPLAIQQIGHKKSTRLNSSHLGISYAV